MKTSARILISVVLAAVSTVANASYDDMATVKNVTPIYSEQMQQQQQVCTGSSYQQNSDRSNTGSAIGGIAGALLGSRVGGGNGRVAATAVGAVIGAITGDRVDNRQPMSSGMSNCHWEQVQTQPRVTGYLVTFEYQGHVFQNMMSYDPTQNGGGNIRVAVNVMPR